MLLTEKVTALEVCGKLKQGELILIKDENTQHVKWLGKNYPLINGKALLAVPCNAAKHIELVAFSNTNTEKFYNLPIIATKWDIQHIKGVAKHHVTPSKQHQQDIAREQQDVKKALADNTTANFWSEDFIEPVKGRISGNFGNQRVFNGIPKNPHNGTDIAAPEGTEVRAAGSGIIVLSNQNYFFSGNMVIINHGQGLKTIYAHLQKTIVKQGDRVQKGDVIGYVGKTGRATGAHLHWGASLYETRFRPHALLDIYNSSCQLLKAKDKGE